MATNTKTRCMAFSRSTSGRSGVELRVARGEFELSGEADSAREERRRVSGNRSRPKRALSLALPSQSAGETFFERGGSLRTPRGPSNVWELNPCAFRGFL